MLQRFALASVIALASCAPAPVLAPIAPQACVEPPPPAQHAPVLANLEKIAEEKPALSLEPIVAGDAARWKITNHTSEPLQLGIEHAQQYWARDCRSPLERIGNDGRIRCMPIHIETNVPAYAKLDPGASAEITLALQFDSRGPEPALPAGSYRLAIPTTNPNDRSNGPTAEVKFRLEGLDEGEAKALVDRVAFATEHGCSHSSDLAQRALAWTASYSNAQSALGITGVPWMRARYARLLAIIPEGQEKLRSELRGVSFDTAIAIEALLSPRAQPPVDVREDALRILPSVLGIRGFDPILVQAVAHSDKRASIVRAVAFRVLNADTDELGQWDGGLACFHPRPGDELALAELIHAFRVRAKNAKPDFAASLRTRADMLETQLRERRDEVAKALQIARVGLPPFNGPNALTLGKGCGFGIRGSRPNPVCKDNEISPSDPALRFLSTPMKLVLE